jgi:hypothetical protein
MKKLAIALSILSFACAPVFAKGSGGYSSGHSSSHSYSSGSHSIKGYSKSDGTYVAPSHATNPNSSKYDNWSTKGNVNPYTGKEGTKDPYTGK